jgi:hypothetical protein
MRRPVLRATMIGVLCAVVMATDVEAQGNWQPGDFGSVRFRAGLFTPEGNSQYWEDKFADFSGSVDSFRDFTWGLDYMWRTSQSTGVLFGTSFFNGKATQSYLDWVDADGRDISHTTSLELWDLTAAFVWRFGRGGLVPYVGLGGGFQNWKLEETGNFIDFGDPELPIVFAGYRSSDWTYELFGLAGVDVPLAYQWSFFVEGRYRYSEDELADDFSGFGTVDLSGTELTAGFSWNF